MSSYIRQIQTTLQKAGYYKGKIDGLAGKLTVEAVNKATANEILEAERTKSYGTIEYTQDDVKGIIEHSILLRELARKNKPRN